MFCCPSVSGILYVRKSRQNPRGGNKDFLSFSKETAGAVRMSGNGWMTSVCFPCQSGVKTVRPRKGGRPGAERSPPDHRVYGKVCHSLDSALWIEKQAIGSQGDKTEIGSEQNCLPPISKYTKKTLKPKETSLPCHFKGFLF